MDLLVTTDERRGIQDEKIVQIIEDLRQGDLKSEDKHKHHSEHHYYLR